MSHTLRAVRVLMAVVPAGIGVPTASGQCYSLTDLGTLPGASEIHVRDINSSGQVVGYALTTVNRAFLYSGGVMSDLGTLEGDVAGFAHGINDAGQVVGASQTRNGLQRAFIRVGGLTLDMGTLGGSTSAAYAINDAGQVCGLSSGATGECRGFVWQDGRMFDIGLLGESLCQVWDINNRGQVVGVHERPIGEDLAKAFAWNSTLGIVDLTASAANQTVPYRISDTGIIVGETGPGVFGPASTAGVVHAFVYRTGGLTDIGTLGGQNSGALSINTAGQIVGWSQTADGQERAFLYDTDGGMRDLNTMIVTGTGWVLEKASAINDAGQIAGTGTINGQQRAFILTPQQADANHNGIPDACEVTQPSQPTPTTGGGLPLGGCGAAGPMVIAMTLAGLAGLRFTIARRSKA